jgi:hypothetical protein
MANPSRALMKLIRVGARQSGNDEVRHVRPASLLIET